jgi:hypothetical protein
MDALLPVLVAAVTGFAIGMQGLAVGVITSRRCLRGSCGGRDARASDGTPISCASRPNERARTRV